MEKDAPPTPDPGKSDGPLPGQDAKAESGGSSDGGRRRPTRYELLREDWIEVQSL
jgi:hypothetical protein